MGLCWVLGELGYPEGISGQEGGQYWLCAPGSLRDIPGRGDGAQVAGGGRGPGKTSHHDHGARRGEAEWDKAGRQAELQSQEREGSCQRSWPRSWHVCPSLVTRHSDCLGRSPLLVPDFGLGQPLLLPDCASRHEDAGGRVPGKVMVGGSRRPTGQVTRAAWRARAMGCGQPSWRWRPALWGEAQGPTALGVPSPTLHTGVVFGELCLSAVCTAPRMLVSRQGAQGGICRRQDLAQGAVSRVIRS